MPVPGVPFIECQAAFIQRVNRINILDLYSLLTFQVQIIIKYVYCKNQNPRYTVPFQLHVWHIPAFEDTEAKEFHLNQVHRVEILE